MAVLSEILRLRLPGGSSVPPSPTPDLKVVQARAVYRDDGLLDHLHLETREKDELGRELNLHRVVRLLTLRSIPQEQRQQATMIARAVAFLQGVYTARVDLIRLNAGFFRDPYLGVVQFWGVRSEADNYPEARERSAEALAVLESGLPAVYEKSRWRLPDTELFEAVRQLFTDARYALVQIGHPAPRETARGPMDTDRLASLTEALQQAEQVYRGMAALKEDFIHLVLAVRLREDEIVRLAFANAAELSTVESTINGSTGVSLNFGVPILVSKAISTTAGAGYGMGKSVSHSEAFGETHGEAHTTGYARSVADGEATTHGTAETWGESHSHTAAYSRSEANGTSHVESQATAVSHGEAHTTSHNVTDGTTQGTTATTSTSTSSSVSAGTATGYSSTNSQSWSTSQGGGHTVGQQTGTALSHGHASTTSRGTSESVTGSTSIGMHGGLSLPLSGDVTLGEGVIPAGASIKAGITPNFGTNMSVGVAGTVGTSSSTSETTSDGLTVSTGTGESTSQSWSTSHGGGHTVGTSQTTSAGIAWNTGASQSTAYSSSVSHSETFGEAHTTSQGVTHSHGTADGISHTTSHGMTIGTTHSTSHSRTVSEAHTTSHAEGQTWSQANTESHVRSRVQAAGYGSTVNRQQALAQATGSGITAGVSPSLGFSRTWQTKDVRAEEYALVLRAQQTLLDIAQQLGAFWTDSYFLARTPRGRAALAGLVAEAFRGVGDGIVTPVTVRDLSPEEEAYIRLHAFAFSPSRRIAPLEISQETYWDATLLPSTQLAALVAPGLFEEGPANTTREAIPRFRFEPNLPGDVLLGHQISYEREEVVPEVPMVIDIGNTHNVGIFGDTGMGKSHLVMWLVYELVTRHNQAVMVMDMSTTERGLAHVLPDRVEVYSLYPGGPNPVPWNPMQIGGRVGPTAHKNAILESLRTVGGLGERQAGLLNDTLRDLYLEHGVLTDDAVQMHPELDERVQDDPNSPWAQTLQHWARVVDIHETDIVNRVRAERGLPPVETDFPLAELGREERQALARERSKAVNLGMLYRMIRRMASAKGINQRDQEAFSGIAQRLVYFNEGPLGAMYARQVDSVNLNDLLKPGKIVVLETGVTPDLPEGAKGVLLNLAFLLLYMERAYILSQEGERAAQAVPTWVVLEEANKILAPTATAEQAGKVGTSSLMETIARDCRKFGFRLIVTGQNPSLIPMPVLTNCNTVLAGKLKGIEDRKMIIASFARSEAGFTDEDYKRFQSSMPKYWFIALLGLERDNWKADPILFQSLEMPTYAPSDAELCTRLNRGSRKEKKKDRRKG